MISPSPLAGEGRERGDEAMANRGDARFKILDAMAMVAAAAVGAACVRSYYEQVMSVSPTRSGLMEYRGWVYLAALIALPFVAALAWCRLRRSFRPTRRLAREPGTVAPLAAAVTLVATVVDQVLMLTLPGPPGTRFLGVTWRPLVGPAAMLATVTGPAVCAAWSVQWLAGHWRLRPGWIDHAGMALGMVWIVLFLLRSWFLLNLWP